MGFHGDISVVLKEKCSPAKDRSKVQVTASFIPIYSAWSVALNIEDIG